MSALETSFIFSQWCHKQINVSNYKIAHPDVCLFDFANSPPNVQFSLLKKHSSLNAKYMLIGIIEIFPCVKFGFSLGWIILLSVIKRVYPRNSLWKLQQSQ